MLYTLVTFASPNYSWPLSYSGNPNGSPPSDAGIGNCSLFTVPATLTGLAINSASAADDDNENFTVTINDIPTTCTVHVPNGSKSGSITGLTIPISPGDLVAIFQDPTSNADMGLIQATTQIIF